MHVRPIMFFLAAISSGARGAAIQHWRGMLFVFTTTPWETGSTDFGYRTWAVHELTVDDTLVRMDDALRALILLWPCSVLQPVDCLLVYAI